MSVASRWTARLLLLVMLVPPFGPAAMATTVHPGAMHCSRQPAAASTPAPQPEMPCHHAMARSKASQQQVSFQATDSDCCENRCCCGATTFEWARPASSLLACLNLLVEPSQPSQAMVLRSSALAGADSARAPPRSSPVPVPKN